MNGADKIVENILSEARQSAAQTVADAEKQADGIVKAAVDEAESKALEKMIKARKEAAETGERALSAANLEARKRTLAAKREIIDEVFDRVELELSAMNKDEYVSMLARLASSDEGGGTLVFSEKDFNLRSDVAKQLDNSRFTVSDDTAEGLNNGFMLVSGAVETNYSISALVGQLRQSLERPVAEVLFGGKGE